MMMRILAAVVLVACSSAVAAQDVAIYESTLGALPLSEPIYLDTHLLRRGPDGRPHIADRPEHVVSAPSAALKRVAEHGDYIVCRVRSDDACRSMPGTYVAMTEIRKLPNGQIEVGVAEITVFEEGGAIGGRTWIVRLEDDTSPRVISKTVVYAWDAG